MDERESALPASTAVRRRATSVPPPPKLTLSSRNSSAATSSSSLSDDAEPLSAVIMPATSSYTSLKDLIPSFVADSPRDTGSDHEGAQSLSVRNRLVKRAAWGYPRTSGTSAASEGGGLLLGRVWPRVSALLDGVKRGLVWAFEWALWVVGMRSSR